MAVHDIVRPSGLPDSYLEALIEHRYHKMVEPTVDSGEGDNGENFMLQHEEAEDIEQQLVGKTKEVHAPKRCYLAGFDRGHKNELVASRTAQPRLTSHRSGCRRLNDGQLKTRIPTVRKSTRAKLASSGWPCAGRS